MIYTRVVVTIIGISGSLRQGSYNTALLRAGAAMMPPDSRLEVRTIGGIPLYDADEEAERGIPAAVTALKEAIAAADGLLFATPEYNNSMPGVAKNAVDWLSRPPADAARVFAGKPVAIAGASPGGFGTLLSQNAWLPVWRTLGADLWAGGRMAVSRAGAVFGPDGAIHDGAVNEALRKFLEGFVAYARTRPKAAGRA